MPCRLLKVGKCLRYSLSLYGLFNENCTKNQKKIKIDKNMWHPHQPPCGTQAGRGKEKHNSALSRYIRERNQRGLHGSVPPVLELDTEQSPRTAVIHTSTSVQSTLVVVTQIICRCPASHPASPRFYPDDCVTKAYNIPAAREVIDLGSKPRAMIRWAVCELRCLSSRYSPAPCPST